MLGTFIQKALAGPVASISTGRFGEKKWNTVSSTGGGNAYSLFLLAVRVAANIIRPLARTTVEIFGGQLPLTLKLYPRFALAKTKRDKRAVSGQNFGLAKGICRTGI